MSENEVNTMTKHRDNHISKSYRAEMSIPVATILAGFNSKDTNDTYFVPRAEIQLPNNLADADKFSELQNFLFPHLQRWKQELMSDAADKSFLLSGEHFLFQLIPWVTKLLLQDGVMWQHKFPQNSALQMLKNRLSTTEGFRLFGENYVTWASNKRNKIKENVKQKHVQDATRLDHTNNIMHSVQLVTQSVEKLQEVISEIKKLSD
jgi:hypothetical protein